MKPPTIVSPVLNYRSYVDQVRLMYRQPVAQVSSALILTFFTISFFGVAAIKPTLATVSKLIGELEEKRLINQKLTTKLENLSLAQERYQTSQSILSAFDAAIPNTQNLDQFLLQFEYLATTHNVSISAITIDPVVVYGPPQSQVAPKKLATSQPDLITRTLSTFPAFSARVSAKGSFPDLLTFLNTVSSLDRVFRLRQVLFAQSQDDDQPDLITLSIYLDTYWSSPLYAQATPDSQTSESEP